MDNAILTNQKLTDSQMNTILSLGSPEDPILFAVIGEISNDANYGKCVLLATRRQIFTYDLKNSRSSERYCFSDVKNIYNKRMYGNAVMRLETLDGTTVNLFRFTFTVTALCDAVANYVKEIRDGNDPDAAFDVISATYEKMLSVCPKCGRTLSAPGIQCIHCMKKGRILKKLWSYMRPEAPFLVTALILSIFTTTLTLVPPILNKTLVDDILIKENPPEESRNALLSIVILLLAVHLTFHTVRAVHNYILRISGHKIVARIRTEVYEKAQYLPMRFYDKTSTGSVINRISSDTATIQAFMLRVTQEVIVNLFKMIGIVIVMLFLDWKLTIFSLIPIPVVVIGTRIFRKKIAPFYRRIWKRSSAMTSMLADTIPGIRVIKSFANEKKSAKRFESCVEEWRETDAKAGKIITVFPSIVNGIMACGSVIIWALGGNLVIDGFISGDTSAISVGLLVSFISYAAMFYEPINFFANFSDSIQNATASMERIMDILDAESEHDFGKGNKNVDMGGVIEFKNVNFSFDRTKKVLKDINLRIEAGEIVGIVGTTGSGKSTLANLLLRYYDHYEGLITIDGVDIKNIDMNYYRSSIGYVQQEPQMFNDTIYNNIAYGDETFTTDEVINAANVANAHEFIVRQPDGYDSMLGERGIGVSGGEKQRISIARAMLRNPGLLIFDEATASVDSETEHLIQQAIDRLISGRTTIMIAHRLSTLSKANKIVVIDNGKIIECGTPDELLALKGKYYKLVEIQSMSDKVEKDKEKERFS